MRVGQGYDSHQFAEGRPLVLGGVTIPYEKGLMGHSDADCLLHAIIDALLGAACLGDIGTHFPDSDPKWKDVDSKVLLALTYDMLKSYHICNIDATIQIEQPRMAPYIVKMRKCISKIMNLDMDRISIKAKTDEGMGFVGREEGVRCSAICLLVKK